MFLELEISYYNPNTPDTNYNIIFRIEKLFLLIIGAQNQLPITFCSD